MAIKEFSQMDELESQLFARLKPIQPRSEFVDHLKYRLENPPTIVAETPSWKAGVTILAVGLLGGFTLFALFRKFVRWMNR